MEVAFENLQYSFDNNARGVHPVGREPVVHGLRLGDMLALAHAAGDDGDCIGMLV